MIRKFRLIFTAFILLTGIFVIICNYESVYIFNSFKQQYSMDSESSKSYKLGIPKFNHSKWIVVTSISEPTEQVKQLVAIPNWKMVVVGDEKTPKNWSYPGCVYLSVEDQLKLGYRITEQLPYNSYTRKIIGYLFAIQNGAQFIYDTDDDNSPLRGDLDFRLEPISSGLVYADLTEPVMNPYVHFGQPELWPRGFPLERIASPPNSTYHLCTFNTPAIQQGLVNGEPDMDAIYRLINKGSNTHLNINLTFDSHAPPLHLPQGVFAPFNSQNTLFSYNAFWALLLPTTVAFRVTDIWRGYWAQRLLWLTGRHLAFYPPNAVQVRNAHSYLKDFEEEIQMYKEAGKLIDFLTNWQCNSATFFECVEWLSRDMVKQRFIQQEDLYNCQLWLSDLRSVGYKEPDIAEILPHEMCFYSETGTSNWVNYSPVRVKPNAGVTDLYNICEEHLSYDNSSKENVKRLISSKQSSFTFENILLVIVFNFPYFKNVRMLEALYRDHFPNILICGQSSSYEDLMEIINTSSLNWRDNNIAFVNATDLFNGFYGYECAIRAIEMNYKVDGYMIIGDDTFLKPWKLLPFDPNRSRLQNDTFSPYCYQHLAFPFSVCYVVSHWWYQFVGYGATNHAYAEINTIANSLSDPRNSIFQAFTHNRYTNGVIFNLASINLADFYYISQQDSWIFAQVLKIFLKHHVFLEIAVASVMIGCRNGDAQNKDGMFGTSIWYEQREDPFKYFTNKTVYVHPLKLTQLESNETFLKKYCQGFVHDYLSNW